MAKKELQWTPLLGQFMTLSNAVFINRSKRTDAVAALAKVAETMKKKSVRSRESAARRDRVLTSEFFYFPVVALHFPRGHSFGIARPFAPPVQKGRVPSRSAGPTANRSHCVRELRGDLLEQGEEVQQRRDRCPR